MKMSWIGRGASASNREALLSSKKASNPLLKKVGKDIGQDKNAASIQSPLEGRYSSPRPRRTVPEACLAQHRQAEIVRQQQRIKPGKGMHGTKLQEPLISVDRRLVPMWPGECEKTCEAAYSSGPARTALGLREGEMGLLIE